MSLSASKGCPKNLDDVTLLHLLQPMFSLLKFYGIYITEGELSTWKKCHSVLGLFFSATVYVFFFYYNLYEESSAAETTSFLVITLCFGAQMISSHNMLLQHRAALYNVFQSMCDIHLTLKNTSKTVKIISQWKIYSQCVITTNAIIWLTILLANQSCYNTYVQSIIGIGMGLRILFTIVTPIFYIALYLYVFSCYIMSTLLRNVFEVSWSLACHDVRNMHSTFAHMPQVNGKTFPKGAMDDPVTIQYHHSICSTVTATNVIFREVLFVWSATALMALLYLLREMNLHLPNSNVDFFVTVTFLITGVIFCVNNTVAGFVNTQVTSSLKDLQVIPAGRKEMFIYYALTHDDVKVKLYIQQVLLRPPALTGWGLYTASSSTMFTAAANILTYVLVLYRLPAGQTRGDATHMPTGSMNDSTVLPRQPKDEEIVDLENFTSVIQL